MAEDKISENRACVVNCLGDEQRHLVAEFLTELTGSHVDASECASGSTVCWLIKNKYYSAAIEFSVQDSFDGRIAEQQWEAAVFLADLNKSFVVDVVSKTWALFPSDRPPSTVLLVGTLNEQDGSCCYQPQALDWCVKHSVELVEWERGRGGGEVGNEGDSEDEEEDYPGVARVSEALQAHMWPCMEMKTESHDRSHDLAESKTQEVKSKASPGDSAAGNTSALEALLEETDCSTASQKEKTQKKIDSMLSADQRLLAEGLDGDKDPGGESFEQLFSRFAEMKAHAAALPSEERKEYAEKVVMAFWDAIGGDEGEVKLDDSEIPQ